MGYNEELEQIIDSKKKLLPYLSGPALYRAIGEIAYLSNYLGALKNKKKEEEQQKLVLQNVAMANYTIDQEKQIIAVAKETEKIARILGLNDNQPLSPDMYIPVANPGTVTKKQLDQEREYQSRQVVNYSPKVEKKENKEEEKEKEKEKPKEFLLHKALEQSKTNSEEDDGEELGKTDFQSILRGYHFLDKVAKLHKILNETLEQLDSEDSKLSEEQLNACPAAKEYAEMKEALQECVEASDESNEKAGANRLFVALEKYHIKAQAYQEARKNLKAEAAGSEAVNPEADVTEKRADKIRLNVISKWLKKAKKTIRGLKTAATGLSVQAKGFFRISDGDSQNPANEATETEMNFKMYRTYLEEEIELNDYNQEDFKEENRQGKWFRADDYEWMFFGARKECVDGFVVIDDPWYQGIKDEQWEQIREDSGIHMSKNYSEGFAKEAAQLNTLLKSDPQNGYNPSCPEAAQSVFTLWLMGHKGLSVKEVTKFVAGEKYNKNGELMNEAECKLAAELRAEFAQFCKVFPVSRVDAANPEAYQTSIRMWSKCFKNATDRLNEYTIPDLDYTDKRQVSRYVDEFVVLSKLGFYFEQEVPRMLSADNLTMPATDIAAQVMGGKKEYRNMLNTWNIMKCVMLPVSNGFANASTIENVDGFRFCDFAAGVGHVAAYRAMAGKLINPYGGMKNRDLIQDAKAESLYMMNASQQVANSFAGNPDERFEYKDSMGFLLGREKETFKKAVEKSYEEKLEEERLLIRDYNYDATTRMISFSFGDMRERFLALGDNPEEMKEFINGQSENNSIRAWINRAFNRELLTDNQQDILARLGLEVSEAFLFDGKTAMELWGDKYADVEDPVEKETLLEAEILKKIATGDSKISMKMWEVSEDGEFVPAEPATVLEKKEKLEDILELGVCYKKALQEALREFMIQQDALIATQKNPRANQNGSEEKEGSETYQAICTALDQVIKDIEGELLMGRGDPYRTRIHFQQLMMAAQNYRQENKNNHNESPCAERYKLADRLFDVCFGFGERIQNIKDSIDSSLAVDARNTRDITEASYFQLLSKMNKIARFLGKPIPSDEQATKRYVADALLRKQLELAVTKSTGRPYPSANCEKAILFLKTEIAELCKNASGTIDDVRRYDNMKEEINHLAGNPLFINMMEKSPKLALEKWREIERKTAQKAVDYSKNITFVRNNYTLLSSYVAGIESPSKENMSDGEKKEIRARARQAIIEKMTPPEPNAPDYIRIAKESERKATYKMLAKVILEEILGKEKESQRLRQEMVAEETAYTQGIKLGGRTYKMLHDKVYDILEGGKVLEGQKLSATLKYLDSGEITKQVQKELLRPYLDNNSRSGLQPEAVRKI